MAKKKKDNDLKQLPLTDWDRPHAASFLVDIDKGEVNSRKKSFTFFKNEGHVLMGFDSVYECLKACLKYTAPSTIYRQINCGIVESGIGVNIGSQHQNAMLEIFKYEEEHWEDIYKYADSKKPSLAQIKAALNLLEQEDVLEVIKPKQQSADTIITGVIEKAKDLGMEDLKELSNQIETLIESLD